MLRLSFLNEFLFFPLVFCSFCDFFLVNFIGFFYTFCYFWHKILKVGKNISKLLRIHEYLLFYYLSTFFDKICFSKSFLFWGKAITITNFLTPKTKRNINKLKLQISYWFCFLKFAWIWLCLFKGNT